MPICTKITSELKAFVDGELSQSQRANVERHVGECSDCRRELSEIQKISSELKSLDTAVPRPELRGRILAQIAPLTEPERPRAQTPFWRNWLPGLALAGAATAVGAAAIIVYATNRNSLSPSASAPARIALSDNNGKNYDPGAPSTPAAAVPELPAFKTRERIEVRKPAASGNAGSLEGLRSPESKAKGLSGTPPMHQQIAKASGDAKSLNAPSANTEAEHM